MDLKYSFIILILKKMERLMNWEQWRIIAISTVSPLFVM